MVDLVAGAMAVQADLPVEAVTAAAAPMGVEAVQVVAMIDSKKIVPH